MIIPTQKTIEVRNGPRNIKKLAFCIGDFGIFQMERMWFMCHLPSGFYSSFAFRLKDDALEAIQEINSLKNTWAFLDKEDLIAYDEQIRAICKRFRGIDVIPHKTRSEPKNILNGYGHD